MIRKFKSNPPKNHNLIYIINMVLHGLRGGGGGKKIGTNKRKTLKLTPHPPRKSLFTYII